MSRCVSSTALALVLLWSSSASVLAIRSKPQETSRTKTAVPTAADALASGLKHLDRGDELEAASPKAAKKAYESAAKDLQLAAKLDASSHKTFTVLGYAYRKLGQFDRALQSYDRALQLEPESTQAIEYRAEAYLALNRLDEAKRAYMHLFVHDRSASNVLMKAMREWVDERKTNTAGVDAQTLAAFASWVEERGTLAASVGNLGHNSPDWK